MLSCLVVWSARLFLQKGFVLRLRVMSNTLCFENCKALQVKVIQTRLVPSKARIQLLKSLGIDKALLSKVARHL